MADASSGAGSDATDPDDALTAGGGWLSEDDLLALLDGLGVAGTHDPEDAQEAIAAAEWHARHGGADGGDAREAEAGGEGSAASPVLIGEHLPAGPGLAAVLAQDAPAGASDWDLPGLAAGYRRLAAWAQARELAAVAEIAARRAAANPRIGADERGRPAVLPPEAAAEVALELVMSQPGAAAWTALGCQLRWALPRTAAALAAGTIDLARARVIAEATGVLTDQHAAQVEARVLPGAAGQTTGQLRAAVRRAVLAVDPEGAEQRRRDTERSARVGLYPGEEGTATLAGSCLPGVQAAAAMARITAMARALKASGARGGLDLLRAHIFLGLMLGTLPPIPPPADGPPDDPPPADDGPPPADDGPPPADESPAGDDSPTGQPGGGSSAPGSGSSAPDSGSSAPDSGSSAPDSGGSAPDSGSSAPEADGGASPAPDSGSRAPEADGGASPASPARGDAVPDDAGSDGSDPAPDGEGPASPAASAASSHAPGATDRGESRRAEQDLDDLVDMGDLPGWWPDIPPPADGDAPPGDGDPPEPDPMLAGQPGGTDDDDDDDWPPLPPPDWPGLPAQLPAVPEPPGPGGEGARQARTGLLDLLIPWSALAGHTHEPAILGRIGPITTRQAHQILLLAGRSPATQWRVIVTGDDGRALAAERARPPWRTPAGTDADVTGVIGRVTVTIRASQLTTETAVGGACPLPFPDITAMVLRAASRAAARTDAEAKHDAAAGGCAHTTATDAYRPPPRLREHIAARDKTCRFGPCGQPAWRTDLDHTIPWHNGGLTCGCNLGGFCRTHHLVKHLPGWQVHQPQPGTFRWTTPAGRSYLVQPDPYPV